MKKTIGILILTLASGTLAFAQEEEVGRWYLKADVGGNWMGDSELKSFFGPVAPGTEIKFDPGIRVGVAGGYNFTDWFALEAELGFYGNSIDAISGAYAVEADFAQVPLLVNAKLQYANSSPFTPYIGAGVGFSSALINVDALQVGSTFMSGDEADVVFAWQAFAGVRYKMNDNMSLGLEYRYLGAEGPDFEADVALGTPSAVMSFGRTDTHSVSLTFRYTF